MILPNITEKTHNHSSRHRLECNLFRSCTNNRWRGDLSVHLHILRNIPECPVQYKRAETQQQNIQNEKEHIIGLYNVDLDKLINNEANSSITLFATVGEAKSSLRDLRTTYFFWKKSKVKPTQVLQGTFSIRVHLSGESSNHLKGLL